MQPQQVCGRRLAVTWIPRRRPHRRGTADRSVRGGESDIGNSRPAPLNLQGFVNIRRSGKDSDTDTPSSPGNSSTGAPGLTRHPGQSRPSSSSQVSSRRSSTSAAKPGEPAERLRDSSQRPPGKNGDRSGAGALERGGNPPRRIAAEHILTTEANDRSVAC